MVKETRSINRGMLEMDFIDEYWEKRYTVRALVSHLPIPSYCINNDIGYSFAMDRPTLEQANVHKQGLQVPAKQRVNSQAERAFHLFSKGGNTKFYLLGSM